MELTHFVLLVFFTLIFRTDCRGLEISFYFHKMLCTFMSLVSSLLVYLLRF